ERVRDGARADRLEERRDGGGVAEARAVVDVVRAEDRAHELLEDVRLLDGALGGAEARERGGAVRRAGRGQAGGDEVERLVPARLAERGQDLGVVDEAARAAAAH